MCTLNSHIHFGKVLYAIKSKSDKTNLNNPQAKVRLSTGRFLRFDLKVYQYQL